MRTNPTWPGDRAFPNKPLDATGLTQVGARYYEASIGRFISVDPVMDTAKPQQWAACSYAENNPIAYSDPRVCYPSGSTVRSAPRVSRGGRRFVGTAST